MAAALLVNVTVATAGVLSKDQPLFVQRSGFLRFCYENIEV